MADQQLRLRVFVWAVVLAAAGAVLAAWDPHSAFPGCWPLATFLSVSTFLEGGLSTRLRLSASGSIGFVMHLASALLFGPFWAAAIAGLSTLLGNVARGKDTVRTFFNVSQIVLAIILGYRVYVSLGGGVPPAYLLPGASLASNDVQRDLGLFFVFAASYFVANSLAVSAAISLSSDRALREVWNLNTAGVLGYDIFASAIALLLALLYKRFELWWGFGSLGVLGVVVPIAAIRHVYGLYRQLQDSGQELLQVMVKAIEARDPYTSGHSVRVSRFSRTIAVELGLSAQDIEQIETAALLHDVGKIHEEFAPLLRKESRLTAEETALMQTHAARSADLVGIISKFHGAIQLAVRHHHERWDGRGYPDGLSGDRIPVGARIILVSDTIDAMTTDRPYRKRLPLEVVVVELQKHKGTQFDPRVVEVAVSSVAVRRLISEPAYSAIDLSPSSPKSLRLTWTPRRIWRNNRA